MAVASYTSAINEVVNGLVANVIGDEDMFMSYTEVGFGKFTIEVSLKAEWYDTYEGSDSFTIKVNVTGGTDETNEILSDAIKYRAGVAAYKCHRKLQKPCGTQDTTLGDFDALRALKEAMSA
ncbi:MAG: hypothetical protein KBT34_05495 [Prevotella sp.]|nr:hypothetical protein [Candidatus Prevotella equi]